MRFRMFDRYSENTSFHLVLSYAGLSVRQSGATCLRNLFALPVGKCPDFLSFSEEKSMPDFRTGIRSATCFFGVSRLTRCPVASSVWQALIVCVGISPGQSDFHTPLWAYGASKRQILKDPPFPNVYLTRPRSTSYPIFERSIFLGLRSVNSPAQKNNKKTTASHRAPLSFFHGRITPYPLLNF